jgi:hypothetical protein
MTFIEYLTAVQERQERTGERLGQAYFNVLTYVRPDLADKIRGGHLDPFYRDKLINEFLNAVSVNW